MRRLPPHLAALGYSPARYVPLSPAPAMDQGQRLTDIAAIQRLFANGENGGYWPADPAYLYEDSAGTIQASVNGVVGLRMDQSQGIVGTNLVNNGGFDSNYSGWNFTYVGGVSNISWSEGKVIIDKLDNNTTQFSQGIPVEKGKTYKISANIGYISGTATGSVSVRTTNAVSTSSSILIYSLSTNKSKNVQFYYVAELTGTVYISIYLYTTACAISVDEISVESLNSVAAIQATTANKPYLRRTPVSNKTWLDSNTANGALTATFGSSLGSACTIATVGAEGVTILEGQTIGTTYNIAPYDASQLVRYRGDILIINRVLTSVEKALVTRHFKRGLPTISNGAIL